VYGVSEPAKQRGNVSRVMYLKVHFELLDTSTMPKGEHI